MAIKKEGRRMNPVEEECLICGKIEKKIYGNNWTNPPKTVFKVCKKCKGGLNPHNDRHRQHQ
jgi:uncharacterized CHY-type Zn-finger protein